MIEPIAEIQGWISRSYWMGVGMGTLIGIGFGFAFGWYLGVKHCLRRLAEDCTLTITDSNGNVIHAVDIGGLNGEEA